MPTDVATRIATGQQNWPGASPGVVGFLDYHLLPDGGVYIDYAGVRSDQQNLGYADRLADRLFEKFAKAPYIESSPVADERAEKVLLRKRAEGRDVRWTRHERWQPVK